MPIGQATATVHTPGGAHAGRLLHRAGRQRAAVHVRQAHRRTAPCSPRAGSSRTRGSPSCWRCPRARSTCRRRSSPRSSALQTRFRRHAVDHRRGGRGPAGRARRRRVVRVDARPGPALARPGARARAGGRPGPGRQRRRAPPAVHRAGGRGRVHPAGRHPPRPGRHAARRAGQPARRHRHDRRPGGARVPAHRGAAARQLPVPARLEAHPAQAARRRADDVRAHAARRVVLRPQRSDRVRAQADLRHRPAEGREASSTTTSSGKAGLRGVRTRPGSAGWSSASSASCSVQG